MDGTKTVVSPTGLDGFCAFRTRRMTMIESFDAKHVRVFSGVHSSTNTIPGNQ